MHARTDTMAVPALHQTYMKQTVTWNENGSHARSRHCGDK